MLYVGCGNCRSVVPLFCAGRFMPHMPLYVEGGPMGIYCSMCGPLPPMFTCMQCGVTQLTYLSGAALPRQLLLPGAPSTVAPVVRAEPSTSHSELTDLLLKAGKTFLEGFAGHAGNQLGDQFGNWASSWFGDNGSSSLGNGDPWGGGGWQS